MLSSIRISAGPPLYRRRTSGGIEVPGDDLWLFFKDLRDDRMAHWLWIGSRRMDTVDAQDPKPLDFQCQFHCPKGGDRGRGWPSGFDRPYARGIPAKA